MSWPILHFSESAVVFRTKTSPSPSFASVPEGSSRSSTLLTCSESVAITKRADPLYPSTPWRNSTTDENFDVARSCLATSWLKPVELLNDDGMTA